MNYFKVISHKEMEEWFNELERTTPKTYFSTNDYPVDNPFRQAEVFKKIIDEQMKIGAKFIGETKFGFVFEFKYDV